MSLNPDQLRAVVVRPALKKADLWSKAAENLLMGTVAHESAMGTYLKQVRGPALGIYQIEPNTHHDIWVNFLKYRSGLQITIRSFIPPCSVKYHEDAGMMAEHSELATNLAYATLIARIVYLRAPTRLPEHDDMDALAAYWKKYYNTVHGAGTEAQFKRHYAKYVGDLV